MKYKLSELAFYSTEKIEIDKVDESNYISTENILPNKSGICLADKLPQIKKVNAYKNGDILISNIRPYFKKIWFANRDGGHSADVLNFRAKEGVSNRFLYALLFQDSFFNQMVLSSKGTKMPRGDKNAIMNLEFEVPSYSKQEKISDILFYFQDKIELNNQIISNLEELASTLFKRWFVDFEFPDENGNPYKSSGGKMDDSEFGEIPECFQVKKLSDIADVIGGGTPSKKVKEYFEDGNISWITPKDLSINKNIFIDRGKTSITRLGLNKSSAKLLPKNSILFSSRAPIGYTAISKNELATNQGFKSLIALDGIPYQFIFHFIRNNVSKFESIATGSTFKEVSGTAVKNFKIVLPTEEVLQNYADVTSPLFKKIKIVEEENNILTELRDSLLPKLLSGEIELPEDEGV